MLSAASRGQRTGIEVEGPLAECRNGSTPAARRPGVLARRRAMGDRARRRARRGAAEARRASRPPRPASRRVERRRACGSSRCGACAAPPRTPPTSCATQASKTPGSPRLQSPTSRRPWPSAPWTPHGPSEPRRRAARPVCGGRGRLDGRAPAERESPTSPRTPPTRGAAASEQDAFAAERALQASWLTDGSDCRLSPARRPTPVPP